MRSSDIHKFVSIQGLEKHEAWRAHSGRRPFEPLSPGWSEAVASVVRQFSHGTSRLPPYVVCVIKSRRGRIFILVDLKS